MSRKREQCALQRGINSNLGDSSGLLATSDADPSRDREQDSPPIFSEYADRRGPIPLSLRRYPPGIVGRALNPKEQRQFNLLDFAEVHADLLKRHDQFDSVQRIGIKIVSHLPPRVSSL